MHEFAIAEALVKAILAEMETAGLTAGSLQSATVVVGALQQIVPENLDQAFRVLVADTPARGAGLTIETVPVRALCPGCGWEGAIRGGIFLCPECAGGNLSIVAGRELYLASLEVKDRDNLDQSVPESG